MSSRAASSRAVREAQHQRDAERNNWALGNATALNAVPQSIDRKHFVDSFLTTVLYAVIAIVTINAIRHIVLEICRLLLSRPADHSSGQGVDEDVQLVDAGVQTDEVTHRVNRFPRSCKHVSPYDFADCAMPMKGTLYDFEQYESGTDDEGDVDAIDELLMDSDCDPECDLDIDDAEISTLRSDLLLSDPV
jgi:hypothetical protein